MHLKCILIINLNKIYYTVYSNKTYCWNFHHQLLRYELYEV